MKREWNKMAMTLAVLMLGCGVAHAAESAHEESSNAHSATQRVKHVAVRAFEATRQGIERGAEATVHGVKRGAQATGHGIETGAHAVGRVAHRVAEKF
jgi:hypothetical protein